VRSTKRVTIEDVAARAGVHAATVSRALSRPEQVAPATRERVQAVVDEMGFVLNRAARGLKLGRTGNVAVIVPDVTNPHFAALVRSAERAAREADLQLLLVDTGEQPDLEVRAARSLATDVDGFVVLSARRLHRDLDVIGTTTAVFVDRPVKGHASVVMRAAPATAEALRHLASLGHRHVVHVAGPKASWAAGERRGAVRRTGKASGVQVTELDSREPTFDGAAELVDDIVASGATAVIAFNDQMALGVIAGLAQQGISVPDEMSVVGCDDVPMAAMMAPPLTTIHMPVAEAGAAAVRLLQDGGTVELASELVVRGSTGPVTNWARTASAGAGGGRRPSGAGRG
jgi:DNA-binding LacI/PurR family transcriptional regulator